MMCDGCVTRELRHVRSACVWLPHVVRLQRRAMPCMLGFTWAWISPSWKLRCGSCVPVGQLKIRFRKLAAAHLPHQVLL